MLSGATLKKDQGWALDAQGFSAGHGIFLGAPRSRGAAVQGSSFHGGVRIPSLQANLVVLDGVSVVSGGFEGARGPFSVYGYGIRADELHADSLTCSSTADFSLSEIRLGAYLLVDRVDGSIDLSHSTVAGELLIGQRRDAAGQFRLRGAAVSVLTIGAGAARAGPVDLSDAQIGTLEDDPRETAGGVRLSRATIARITQLGSSTDRAAWLAAAGEPSYDSYLLLASLFRQDADHAGAARLLIEGRRRRRRREPLGRRVWGHLRDIATGYGHRMWRLGAALAMTVLIATVILSDSSAAPRNPTASVEFEPLVFAVDAALPGVTLGQEEAFSASGAGAYAYWSTVLIGYFLTTLLVAGVVDRLRE
ncbi:MAG: hypothetical protein ACFCVG_14895 [Kineosporiaceae bacterium]